MSANLIIKWCLLSTCYGLQFYSNLWNRQSTAIWHCRTLNSQTKHEVFSWVYLLCVYLFDCARVRPGDHVNAVCMHTRTMVLMFVCDRTNRACDTVVQHISDRLGISHMIFTVSARNCIFVSNSSPPSPPSPLLHPISASMSSLSTFARCKWMEKTGHLIRIGFGFDDNRSKFAFDQFT